MHSNIIFKINEKQFSHTVKLKFHSVSAIAASKSQKTAVHETIIKHII